MNNMKTLNETLSIMSNKMYHKIKTNHPDRPYDVITTSVQREIYNTMLKELDLSTKEIYTMMQEIVEELTKEFPQADTSKIYGSKRNIITQDDEYIMSTYSDFGKLWTDLIFNVPSLSNDIGVPEVCKKWSNSYCPDTQKIYMESMKLITFEDVKCKLHLYAPFIGEVRYVNENSIDYMASDNKTVINITKKQTQDDYVYTVLFATMNTNKKGRPMLWFSTKDLFNKDTVVGSLVSCKGFKYHDASRYKMDSNDKLVIQRVPSISISDNQLVRQHGTRYCTNCGDLIHESEKRCRYCGRPLHWITHTVNPPRICIINMIDEKINTTHLSNMGVYVSVLDSKSDRKFNDIVIKNANAIIIIPKTDNPTSDDLKPLLGDLTDAVIICGEELKSILTDGYNNTIPDSITLGEHVNKSNKLHLSGETIVGEKPKYLPISTIPDGIYKPGKYQ